MTYHFLHLASLGKDPAFGQVISYTSAELDSDSFQAHSIAKKYLALREDVIVDDHFHKDLLFALADDTAISELSFAQELYPKLINANQCFVGYDLQKQFRQIRNTFYRSCLPYPTTTLQKNTYAIDIRSIAVALHCLRPDLSCAISDLSIFRTAESYCKFVAPKSQYQSFEIMACQHLYRAHRRIFEYFISIKNRNDLLGRFTDLSSFSDSLTDTSPCVFIDTATKSPKVRLLLPIALDGCACNILYALDLASDIRPLQQHDISEISLALSNSSSSLSMKRINLDFSPLLFPLSIIRKEDNHLISAEYDDYETKVCSLQHSPYVISAIHEAKHDLYPLQSGDVYTQCLQNDFEARDQILMQSFHREISAHAWPSDVAFTDSRLLELALRLKAMSFKKALTPEESTYWQELMSTEKYNRELQIEKIQQYLASVSMGAGNDNLSRLAKKVELQLNPRSKNHDHV